MSFVRSFVAVIQSVAKQRSTMQNYHSRGPDFLFGYTSGRWLWNEQEQQEARYRRFDVAALQKAACEAVGAKRCVSIEKIGEGNSNKAYRLVMEDGLRAVAKIPHPIAEPPVNTTASEVATMEFARTILNIPVPKIFAWSATDQNPVQAEYIIMEEATGSQLCEVWDGLQLRNKRDIIHQIVDIERKLLSISFSKYTGSFQTGLTIMKDWQATTE